MKHKISIVLAFIALLGYNSNVKAQLSGVYNVPSTYTSIGAAITALNGNSVTGPVTIAVAAGYTETAVVGGFTLNSIVGASATNSVVFQKSGVGANPKIIAYTGTATPISAIQDGVWRFIGTDYVIIDGIDIQDNATTNPASMEFGYGFFKASGTNGCQFNAIVNSTITLNKVNNALGSGTAADGSRGIDVVNALMNLHTTAVVVTNSLGSNSNNRFYNNTIQNCNYGIALMGYADVTPFSFADFGNDIGGSSFITGNRIINFGGGAATSAASAIRTLAQYNINVSNNLINNNNGSGVNHLAILRGIYLNTATSANATINSNTITLSGGGTTQQVTPIENVSGATAANNTITISNNLIVNCTYTTATTAPWYGIYNNAANATHLLITGNTFSNNSTNATSGAYYSIFNSGAVTGSLTINDNLISGVSFSAASTSVTNYNIYNSSALVAATSTLNIRSNNITNINFTGVTGHTGTWAGIYTAGSGRMETVQSNSLTNISLKSTGTFYLFYVSNVASIKSFNNNVIVGSFLRNVVGGTGTVYFVYNASGSTTNISHDVFNNNFTNFNNGTCTGSIYMLYWFGAGITTNIYNNTFNNISSASGTGVMYGLYGPYYAVTASVYNNTFTNITYGTGTFYGIYYYNYYATLSNIYNNTVSNVSVASSIVYPLYYYIAGGLTSGGVSNLYSNKITDISTSNLSGVIYGIYEYGQYANQTHNIYNNLIGNLTASVSSNANAITGIYISPLASFPVNVSYNTINLSGTSSGIGFGSSGIWGNTSYPYSLRNNIIVNNMVPTGTGIVAAHRRNTNSLSTYSLNSNSNLYYAGVPSASNVIYNDGTISYSTIASYKALLTSGQDGLSFTENPTFVSTVGTNTNYLAISNTVATQIESGGVTVSGINTDYIGTTRNVGSPDIGAWEGNYIINDLNPPSYSSGNFYAPACTSTLGIYTVNIIDPSGVATGSLAPKVYYSYNGSAYSGVTGALASGTPSNGVWSFSLNYSGTTGGIVAYYLVAQDATTLSNVSSLPSTGFVGVSVNSVTTGPTIPNLFTVQGALSGTYNVGSGQTFTTLTDAVNAYNVSCLAGPVTFQLTDALYSSSETFPITIQNNVTANSTNQLLIKPASGNNATITASSASAIIKMNGADFITIDGSNNGSTSKNLLVENTSTINTSVGFWLGNGSLSDAASNITIRNSVISGSTGLTTVAGILIGSGITFGAASDLPNNSITILSNTFIRFQQAVFGSGNAINPDLNWIFLSNYCGSTNGADKLGFRGILIQNAQSVGILSNTISGISNPNAGGTFYGVFLTGNVFNSNVLSNVINDLKNTNSTTASGFNGIALSSSSPTANILVANNFISDINTFGSVSAAISVNAYGISVNSGAGYKIYHNSVLMNAAPTLTTAIPAPIFIASGVTAAGAIDLRNNIFAHTQTVTAQEYAIYSASTNSLIYSNINNNAYVTNGPNLGFLSSARSNLAAIQLGFGGNLNSTTISPVFTSLTDLHLPPTSNALFDNLGTPVVGVTTDFDGQTRSGTTPDIGADEYTAPPCSGAPSANSAITNSAVICPSVAVNFSLASNYSVTGLTYQWLSSTTSSTSGFATVSTATQAVWTATDIGVTTWYQCVITCSNSGLTATTSVAQVAINTPTNVLTVANIPAVCPGQNVNVLISGTLPPGYSYQWMSSSTASNSGYSNIPFTTSVAAVTNQTINTWYQVQMSCTSNTLFTSFSTPTLVPLGVPFTTLNTVSTPSILCYTNSVNLSLSGTGAGLTYSWLASTTASNSGYSAMPGATLATTAATNLTGSNWFQSVVSCSSAPNLSLVSNPAFLSAGTITNSVPYFEGFEGITANNQLPNCSWIASGLGTNCLTYSIAPGGTAQRIPRTGNAFGSFYWTPTNTKYFYSNGIQLIAGNSYMGSMWYATDGISGWTEINLMYGTTQSSVGLTSIAAVFNTISTTYSQLSNVFTPTVSGIYYLAIKEIDTGGPNYMSFDDISITPVVTCTGSPAANSASATSSQVCSGGNALLSLSNATINTGILGLSYAWASATSSAGPYSAISGATLATLNATNITVNTWYQSVITCSNGGGSTTVTPTQIGVLGAPVYTNTPFIENFDATWENRCDNRNVPKAAYWSSNPTNGNNSWRRQDDGLSGAWTNTALGAIAPLSGAGCARFHSYDASSGTSGEMKLYLNMTAASPNYSLSFYHINTSGTDVLNVSLSTDGGATYTNLATYGLSSAWSKKIINLGSVSSSSCILSFSATSDFGVTDIGIDSLEVKTCPNPIVTASSSSVCPGAPAILSASGANAFTWFNAATGSTIGVTPTASTVYSVSGSNGLCAVSRTVQVNTYSVPIISIANSGSACVGTNASLTASGAITYSWSNGLSGATITPSITSNTSYSVLGASAVGCTASANSSVAVMTNSTISASSAPSVCPGQSLNLTASGAVTYTWNTGSTNTVTVYTPSINTTYTVNGTDANGCVNFATATVTMAAVPALTVTATSPSLCAGNAVTITASGANTYSWNTGATSAIISPTLNTSTSYTLLGTSVVGCTATSTSSIQVSPNPTLTFAGSTGICTGQTVNLTVSGANTYSWSTGSLTNSISTTPITNTTYTVTGTDLLGCKTTSTQLVTVAASLSITIAGPSTICVGQAANLTGNGGVTYTWNTGSTTQTIAPTPTITTTYSIVGASGTCSNSGVATVSVNPNPTVTVAGSLTICAGQTTTLTGNGASTYSWSSGASSSTAALSPSTNTTYTLMGTNSVGCSSSVTANVIANPLPIIGVSQTANTICVNSPVSFTASGANTYTWNNTVNASTVALTPTANITAIYTVAATSSVGCVNSRTVALATYSLPVLSITPASATVCSLSQATFNAAGATTYTWNNTVFTQTASFVPTSSTVYTLSGTNTSSCVSTVTVGVTTNTLPILSITPATATVCALSPATFSAGGATTYTWTGNVVSSTVAFTPSASTVYSLTGSNPAGCVTTNTVAVTTNTLPLITVAPSSASVCAFSTSTYAPSGANSYTWANTSSNTLSSVSNSAIITPSASAIYTVSGTNPAGCIASKTLAVGVYNLPTLIINPASPTVCSLSQLTFTATGASTYTWNGTVNTATAVFNPTVNSTYTLVGADVNNCVSTTTVAVVTNTLPIVSINSPTSTTCVFSPVTYTASGANTYSWSTGEITGSINMYPSSNTVYTVTGTSPAGCNTSNTVAISTNSLPIVGITPSLITVCALSNVSLTAAGAVTYTWSNASTNTNVVVTPSASSVFSLAGTNSLGCVGIANAVVITNTLPVIGISASSASNCATSAVSFTANGGTTYTWSTGSNGSTVSVTPSITTTYSVFGVDPNNGCVGSKTISVNTFSLPIVNIATSAASVCPGASASFTASGAQSYSWAIGFAVPSVTVTPSTASVYVVVGTDALGCSSTGSVSLGLFNLPNVAVSPANQTICVNEVASFTASGASSYTWIPSNNNGSTFTVSPVSISFYTVVGLDANACTNYTTFLVNVSKCTGLAQNAISLGQISVFPNPSMGKVTAEFDFDGVKEIHIVNAIGEFILGIKTENKQETFNLSGYAKGIYYVRIKANGQSSNFRVIIE